ncbi:hypothetical protein V2J09_001505 [Rumex salicifolius]
MPPHARSACLSSLGHETRPPLHPGYGFFGSDHHSWICFSADCAGCPDSRRPDISYVVGLLRVFGTKLGLLVVQASADCVAF